VSEKSYALIPHGERCAGCGNAGDEPIEWNGVTYTCLLFDSIPAMEAFGRVGLCQSCQDATRQ
jgi:hypothetical protein